MSKIGILEVVLQREAYFLKLNAVKKTKDGTGVIVIAYDGILPQVFTGMLIFP